MTCSQYGYMMGPFDKGCPRCKNVTSTQTIQSPIVASDVTENSGITLAPCPACQREISSQAFSCPHCGHPIVSQGLNPEINSKTQAEVRSDNTSLKPRTSPVMLSISIICAILFVIGLLQVVVGCSNYATRFDPIIDAKDDMKNQTIAGTGITPLEYQGNMDIATIKSNAIRDASLHQIMEGCGFAVPMFLFTVVSVVKRSKRVEVI